MNSELEGSWKERVVVDVDVGLFFFHFPEGTEENHENLIQDGLFSQIFEPGTSFYETLALPTLCCAVSGPRRPQYIS